MSSPPEEIGPYRLAGLLGEGGFGRVHAARGPQGEVALKVANRRAEELSSPELILQSNELEALVRLRHPGVVEVYEHGYTKTGELYIAMELVRGSSLESLIEQRGRLDTVVVLGIVGKVAEALAYCHGQGVLHLDLSPSNIIVVDPHEPRIKILDFGLARMSGGFRAEMSSVVGTPQYMAPERFDRATADARMDLYALGVILYEALAGEPPFPTNRPVPLIYEAKIEGDVVPLAQRAPSVPEALAELVMQLMDPDPQRRPGSAEEVARQLKNTFYTALVGSNQPTRGHSIQEIRAIMGPSPRATRGEARFVGRGPELTELRIAYEASQASGQAVAVVGAPGVGKSRLVAQFLDGEPGRASVVAYGRCRKLGGLVPFAPLRESLGQLATRLGRGQAEDLKPIRAALRSDAAAVAELVPELRELAGAEPPAPGDRPSLPRALAALLKAVTSSYSVILVIEDLHWADDAVLDAVTTVSLAPPPGLLLLCTSRQDPRLPGVPSIVLAPLSSEDNDTLLAELVGIRDAEVIAALQQRVPLLARGNPMVATQVLRNLQAQQVLRVGPTGATLDEPALRRYQPPDSIQDVLQRAVAQLGDEARMVLGVAAMLGRSFSLPALGRVGMLPPDRIAAALLEAERVGLCRFEGDRGELVHDAIVAQLEASLQPALRAELHGRIATTLRRRGAPPGTLAHHLEHSGDPLGAALAYLEAGHHAERLHDPKGADAHVRRALDLAGDLPPSAIRSEVLRQGALDLVRNASVLGHTDDLLAHLERCEDRLGDGPHDVAAMSSAFARLYYVKGDFVRAVEHSRACLPAAGDSPALASYRVVPVNVIGRALCASGRFGEAADTLVEGCALAREADDRVELSHSLGMLGLALGYTGDFEAARQHTEQGARLAWAVDDPVRKIAAMFYASVVGEYAYDWDHGLAHAAEALRLAEEHDLEGLYLYLSMMFAGRHQFHIGELGRAAALLEQTLHLSRQYDVVMGLGWAHTFLGDVCFVHGDLDAAWQHYSDGIAAARRGAGDEYAAGIALMGRAAVTAQRGGPTEEVWADGQEAIDRLEAARNRSALAYCLQRFSEALEAVGDPHAASVMEQCHQAFGALGLRWIDWWPAPPKGAQAPEGHRHYWHTARTSLDHEGLLDFEDRVTLSFPARLAMADSDDEATIPMRKVTAVLVSDARARVGNRPLANGRPLAERP
ncbi:MAG: protein kinase [Myxococcales bacterium]|nr:protein kinase [Myxococcales bacterium]